jgi:membrane protein DedA with SNARE-associated domain
MTLKESIINFLIPFTAYAPFICFWGAFFFGMETIVLLGFLPAQGFYSTPGVFVLCALGMLSADIMWFFVGKIKHLGKLKKINIIHQGYKKAAKVIEKLHEGHIFTLMLMLKFVYGIAPAVIMYMGRKKKIKFSKFLQYNVIIIFPWALVLTYIGWLAGKGVRFASDVFKDLKITMLIALVFFVALHFGIMKLSKYLKKKKIFE